MSAATARHAVALADAPTRRLPAARRARFRPVWLPVAAVYLAASLGVNHRVLAAGLDRATTGSVTADAQLFVWWLRWVPYALTHGQDPLYTTWLNAPAGVNGMWNTSESLLAVLLWPVTATAGPVAADNLGMIAGPPVSALAMYLALRPWVRSWAARAVAGALFGFGPFMIIHLQSGHLNLVWELLPPALVWAVHAVLVDPRRPWWAGGALGVAFAVQTAFYTQLVAIGVVVLTIVVVVLAVFFPRAVRARTGAVARAAAAAAAVYGVLCAYPLVLVLVGPARPRTTIRHIEDAGTDVANLVLPGSALRVHVPRLDLAAAMGGRLGEPGAYLGVAVLAVVVLALVVVRAPIVRVTATIGALLVVASWSTTLNVLGVDTGVAMPWQVLSGLPLLEQVEPARFAPFVAACVAVLVAVVVEHALDHRSAVRWVALGLSVAVVVSWVPADTTEALPAATPAFFTSGTPGLGPADVVETVPRPTGVWRGGAEPMLWQAEAGMSYRQVGGYFIGSDARNPLLVEGADDTYQRGLREAVDPAAAAADLVARGVTVVVVVPRDDVDLPAAVAWTRAVTRDPGTATGGVWLFRVPRR